MATITTSNSPNDMIDGKRRPELTLRGIIIGIVITIVFTAANVYFGLKAGLTFSTSIPAAVISMAILKAMRDATIQENNIVQTIASAAGTLSAIIFVLPGLVIVGYWTGFPFWTSAAICATGGILGVMYTIPLRRAMVTDSDLPYPEGVACAEVLKVGSGDARGTEAERVETSGAGLKAVVWGAIVSAVFYVMVQTKVFAEAVTSYFRVGGARSGATGFDFGLSFALLAIGHLVGLWVGVAMLVGALIGWAWAVPYFTHLHWAAGPAADAARAGWTHYVRFMGAGAIGVAAIWTLAKLVKPLADGLAGSFRASRARKAGTLDQLPRTEHDIPIGIVGLVSLLCFIPIGWLLWTFAIQNGLGAAVLTLVIGGVAFVVLMSFLVSAVCGYMAGPDRLQQQPTFRDRHFGRGGGGIVAGPGGEAIPATGRGQSAGRICVVHHRDRFRGGVDRKQQPPGSQNRPTGRCHAGAATVGAGHRRAGGRGRNPAGDAVAAEHLRVPWSPGR